MIKCNFLNLFFIQNFHNKKGLVLSLPSFGTLKYHCMIKTSKMLSFLPVVNSPLTIGLNFL